MLVSWVNEKEGEWLGLYNSTWNIFPAQLRSNQGRLPRGGKAWPEFKEQIKSGQTQMGGRASKVTGCAKVTGPESPRFFLRIPLFRDVRSHG